MDLLVGVTSPTTQSAESNQLDDMRREAETNALRIIQAKLEKPENLEKLDQLRTAAAQRKRVLDEQLRTAVQSQLESIKTGIAQLQISLDNMKTVERTMRETDEKLQKIAPLQSKLEDLRHEANTYRQLSLAQANLDYIIKTPENVKKADDLMGQEKLLQAHQLIMEIENSRNYLLFELHKVQEKDSQPDDIQLVTNYFADYERLVAHLKQLITFRISRWYDCAISAPEKLVTALRLIEREEQVDRFWMEKKELSGFSPPDRPRQWKKLCFELLRKSVKDRIEGNQLETREEHKYWLTRHLEMCRIIILQDFTIITKTCLRCFPKQYDIVNRFLDYYHNCLKEHLTEICDPKRRTEGDTLTTAEVYTIVTFVRDYQGAECLGKPELKLDISQLSPLLEKDILAAVTDVFINERKQKFTEWIPNIVTSEVKDWYALKEVELTSEHYYATTMPRMLINMIIETLDMAKQMSDETCQLILGMILQKINEFRDLYVAEINNYAKRYFSDRQAFKECFTKQMVANANNCESIPNFMLIVRKKYDRDDLDDLSRSSQQQLDRYEGMGKKFERTAEQCVDIILQEIEIDTSKYIKVLFTREWFGPQAKPCCGTIIETTRDYWSSELTHLKKPLLAYLFYSWHKRILAHYLRNLFSRNTPMKFERPEERRKCAEQLRSEAATLDKEFQSWDGTSAENATEYHFNILSNIADVLEQTDLDSIVLEIATLAKKYPSLNMDQVIQILLLRGDLTKQEAKDKADAAIANMPRVNQGILFEIMEIINQPN
ncbi:unnamed protein product [Adineta steineri]|uniref:Exocyst complex component Sec6 n=4 Tax=Adineta steineri TaxID=433720 RepID=A0A813MRX6_9BILA|nr:unnamed protein product [Adineta steineri]CAF0909915.1 unnamed protein product [Adineta steineri]